MEECGVEIGGLEGGTLSHLDIWEPPEPFEVSLQEAINIIWVKLSQLEEGMGPAGISTQDSHLGEPWDSHPSFPMPGTDTPPPLDIYTPGTPTLGIPGDASWRCFLEMPPGLPNQGWTRAELITGIWTPNDLKFNYAFPHQLQPASPPVVSAYPSGLLPPFSYYTSYLSWATKHLPPRLPASCPHLPVCNLPPCGLPVSPGLPR